MPIDMGVRNKKLRLGENIPDKPNKKGLMGLLDSFDNLLNKQQRKPENFNLSEDFEPILRLKSRRKMARKTFRQVMDRVMRSRTALLSNSAGENLSLERTQQLNTYLKGAFGVENLAEAMQELGVDEKIAIARYLSASTMNGRSFEMNLKILTQTPLHNFRIEKLAEIYRKSSKEVRARIAKGPITDAFFHKIYEEYRQTLTDEDQEDYKEYQRLLGDYNEARVVIAEEGVEDEEEEKPKEKNVLEKENEVKDETPAEKELFKVVPKEEFEVGEVVLNEDGKIAFHIEEKPVEFNPEHKVFIFKQKGFADQAVKLEGENFRGVLSKRKDAQATELSKGIGLKFKSWDNQFYFMQAMLDGDYINKSILDSKAIEKFQLIAKVVSEHPENKGAFENAMRELGIFSEDESGLEIHTRKLKGLVAYVYAKPITRYTDYTFAEIKAHLTNPKNLEGIDDISLA